MAAGDDGWNALVTSTRDPVRALSDLAVEGDTSRDGFPVPIETD